MNFQALWKKLGKTEKALKFRGLAKYTLGKLTDLWKTFGLKRRRKCAGLAISSSIGFKRFPQAPGDKLGISSGGKRRKSPSSLYFSIGENLWIIVREHRFDS